MHAVLRFLEYTSELPHVERQTPLVSLHCFALKVSPGILIL